MALKFETKKTMIAEMNEVASKSISALMADYRGLTVTEITDLRDKAREQGVYVKVMRNTLVKRALKDTDFECLHDTIKGPAMMMFSSEDPGAPARIVRAFIKKHEALEVKALSLGSEVLPASQLSALADLPTREQALANLAATLMAPVGKLASTLSETYAQVVRVTHAVAEKKQTEEK